MDLRHNTIKDDNLENIYIVSIVNISSHACSFSYLPGTERAVRASHSLPPSGTRLVI